MDKEKLWRWLDTSHAALFGERLTCVCCGADLFVDGHFCERCLQTLPLNAGFICSKCGRAVGEDYPVCLECKAHMPAYTEARSAFRYEGEIVRLVKKFKTGGRYLAPAFAERMALLLLADFPDADFLVPVPMTERAIKRRGYNQARLLAEEISVRTGIPAECAVLEKSRDTTEQKELSLRGRAENLKGSFHVAERKKCRGARIALIDDVMTTGATANAAAEALLHAGAAKVYLLTAASVPYRGKK
ncbi:MAG TPA: hypothetical protein H9729_07715 [Candidatus Borkfalkia excrementigallinarum]|uniref:ComF family protein n=1 Tax=Candidatus Borkfalkia excrementigallinarum TaxID=2838506 RepID=A0A9D2CTB0_9FIRM|nr:hypothetical protein [Candidatus Borkfalkia excrementigallinarum]